MGRTSYSSCRLCPRRCGADRLSGQKGFCNADSRMMLASAVLHFGEEPPVSGKGGSGTLFFSGCTLGCPYCQNCQISRQDEPVGSIITGETCAEIMLELQSRGAENINLVTASHYIPSLVEVLSKLRQEGFALPVVWNSSGFESIEALEQINPLIDIYLIDIKTLDEATAQRFCRIREYVAAVKESVPWVVRRNPLVYDGDALTGGTIIRHLVLPGEGKSTRDVFSWFARNIGAAALLSVMQQFIDPKGGVSGDTLREDEVLDLLDEYSIDDGFLQEAGNEKIWIPDFLKVNPFPEEFSIPVWHWSSGFITDRLPYR